jgi:hypothetical protein
MPDTRITGDGIIAGAGFMNISLTPQLEEMVKPDVQET